MNVRSFLKYSCLIGALTAFCPTALWSQNYPSQEKFGQNRVQYRRFEWKILKSNNFEVYHYGAGTPIATLTIQYAESEFDRITELLGYTPYNKIKIFLYNSPQELTQSNMGMANTTDLSENELNLAKSRLEIAFTGDQVGFRKQLIREVTQLFVYDMLYGGSLKDALQSSLLLSLPDWFMSGIAAYVADGWSTELDDYMRDAMVRRQLKKPSLLTGLEAEIVGQSLWNYIAERYGKDNVSNILNLTRIIRTEQTSIASTLGVSYSRFLRDWRDFYVGMAATVNTTHKDAAGNWQQSLGSELGTSTNKIKLSIDNQYIALTTRKENRYSVELVNVQKGNRSTILKGSNAVEKRNYVSHTPLIAWHRNNGLAVITDYKGEVLLQIFDINEKGNAKIRIERVIRGVNQVVDFDISNDGASLALSAERDGKNDLYLFNVGRGSLLQLTNDLYDDLTPHFVGNSSSRVLFCSNRLRDSLATDKGSYKTIKDKLALFVHDGNPRAQTVRRVADSLGVISYPRSTNENTFYFLSDYKGINNLYKYEADFRTLTPLTAFNQGIRDYDYSLVSGAFVSINWRNGEEIATYQARLAALGAETIPTPRAQSMAGTPSYKTEQKNNPAADLSMIAQMANPRRATKLDSGEIDTDNYEFDADILKAFEYRQKRGNTLSGNLNIPTKNRRRENITIKGPVNYKGLFISNDATSDIRIDPVRGFGYSQALTMNDLLENHIVRAGFFLATNLRTNDLWAEYSNLSHRIDFSARIDRQSLFVQNTNQKYRYTRFAATASYPFSTRARVSLSPFFAQARLLDVNTIAAPDQTSTYGGVRGEYVYDNARINGMNMMEGTRFKVRYDLFGGLTGTPSFNRIALDLRHYQKVHRDIILATRVSFASSGGAAPKQSALGGMENWIGNVQENRSENPLAVGLSDQQLPIDNRDIFFVELVPLRGFNFNKISGRNHLMGSAELRMPLIKYFYRGPITSNFLRNFQFVAFTDVGAAWTGKSPFDRQSSLLPSRPEGYFNFTVNDFRNPFLLGYGVGARTMLFGFYAKFDYAWGFDNGEVNKAIPYLTLGYDF